MKKVLLKKEKRKKIQEIMGGLDQNPYVNKNDTQADYVEPSGVQALKNPNPLKDDEGWLCLLLLSCLLDRIWGRFNM